MNSKSTRLEPQRTKKVWHCEKSGLGWASMKRRDTQNNEKELQQPGARAPQAEGTAAQTEAEEGEG